MLSIHKPSFSRRFAVSIEVFGERKTLLEWSRDPRCVVKYGTLANRIANGWPPEEAITHEPEVKARVYQRPQRIIEAYGESKTAMEWATDERCVVGANVFLRRVQHGWTPEMAMSTELSSTRGRREGNGMRYEAFGEEKTLRDWVQDPRCEVSEMTLRKNLAAGMPPEEAFQYRRKPGRHFLGLQEDASAEVGDAMSVAKMLNDGGELWVYDSTDTHRISLIHKDVRHVVPAEVFEELMTNGFLHKAFQTDTIKNYDLTHEGRAYAR